MQNGGRNNGERNPNVFGKGGGVLPTHRIKKVFCHRPIWPSHVDCFLLMFPGFGWIMGAVWVGVKMLACLHVQACRARGFERCSFIYITYFRTAE